MNYQNAQNAMSQSGSIRNGLKNVYCEPVATRQAAIPQAQESLDKSLAVLSEKIFTLESRLVRVIRQTPCEIKEPGCQPPNPTTVYDMINASANSVGILIERVEILLQSLEV